MPKWVTENKVIKGGTIRKLNGVRKELRRARQVLMGAILFP